MTGDLSEAAENESVIEALASALLLGIISTMFDAGAAELELQGRQAYLLGRTLAIGFCIGASSGAGPPDGDGCRERTVPGGVGWRDLFRADADDRHRRAGARLGRAFCLLDAMLGEGYLPVCLARAGRRRRRHLGRHVPGDHVWLGEGVVSRAAQRAARLVLWTATFLPGFVALFWRR